MYFCRDFSKSLLLQMENVFFEMQQETAYAGLREAESLDEAKRGGQLQMRLCTSPIWDKNRWQSRVRWEENHYIM